MDTSMIDGNGVSLIIGAACAGIVTVGTFVMQVVTWKDARELKRLSIARDQTMAAQGAQLKVVKDLVNGQSEVVKAYVAKEAYEKGREHERVAPGTPSPVLAVSPVSTVATAVLPVLDPTPADDK
jgi:hypothetical protein